MSDALDKLIAKGTKLGGFGNNGDMPDDDGGWLVWFGRPSVGCEDIFCVVSSPAV
jgi:hypothetical protein